MLCAACVNLHTEGEQGARECVRAITLGANNATKKEEEATEDKS